MPAVDDRRFGDAAVVKALDRLTAEEVEWKLGTPLTHVTYAEPMGHWRPGDGRPSLADDDPAVMQAIGRCAASRVRDAVRVAGLGSTHRTRCAWCDYPVSELLAACDWAVHRSRYILAELAIWHGSDGTSYVRELRSNVYAQPDWFAFFALPPKERAHRIAAAIGREGDS